jgi:hypothetical protein
VIGLFGPILAVFKLYPKKRLRALVILSSKSGKDSKSFEIPRRKIEETAMKSMINSIVIALALVPAAFAQSVTSNSSLPQQSEVAPQTSAQSTLAITPSQEMVLRDGTPVRLRLARSLSSAHAKAGDEIDFDVMDDITIAGKTIMPRFTKAMGVITEAEHKKWAARGGKLNFALQYVRMEDGTKVALRATSDNKGGGHAAAMTAGMVATVALSAGLAAPLFLFIHGKDALVPQGTELTAYVDGDTRLNATDTVAAER